MAAEPAHLIWRLTALVYDSLPVLALWLLVSGVVLALHGFTPLPPWSLGFWLQNLLLWLVTGLYAVESWARGGQTLGMRPWRLKVVAADGRLATRAQLWRRYAWATLALAAAGLGLLWSLWEPQRRGWHDLASATWLLRLPKT